MFKKLNQPAFRFIALFFSIVLLCNLVIGLEWVDENLIRPYTEVIAGVSAGFLGLFGYSLVHTQTFIRSPQFAVDIRRGCDGVVATILLLAACLAYPAPWRQRALGCLMGFGLIFVLNLLRIAVLFALGDAGSNTLFNFVHTYVAQFAVIALTMVFWLRWAGKQSPLYR